MGDWKSDEEFYYTPEYVEARLLEAARVFLNSDIPTRPSIKCSSWPDYPHEWEDMYGWHEPDEVRTRPTLNQITRAYRTLDWLPLIPILRERRAVQWRMYISPYTGEPRSWRWLARRLRTNHGQAQILYGRGISRMVTALNRQTLTVSR